MLTIRTATHIRSARALKGFRSCRASTGVPTRKRETERLLQADFARNNGDARRHWLSEMWHAHEVRLDSPRGH